MALIGEMHYLTIGGSTYSLPSGGGGSVTSVGVSNDTNGGLTVSGSPITSSGTITIGHTNVLTSAQTTQAVYPIKIDKNGHISEYGSAVSIPVVPSNTGSATTGISIGNHSTTSIYGVSSSTTSVYGVSSTTTTASKVTLGTAKSIPNVTSAGSASTWTFESKTVMTDLTMTINGTDSGQLDIVKSTTTVYSKSGGGNGTAPTLGTAISVPNVTEVTDVTVPIKNADATTVPIKNTSATTVVTSATHSVTDNGHTHTI